MATEVVAFMTSVVTSVKPAAVAAIVVSIVSVVGVQGTSGTTRMSENKTAASKSKRCTGCKVTSEANSESAVLTAGAAVAASVALTAGVATSLVLTAGVMVTEPAVGLSVATAVAVSIFLRLVRLLATDAEAALKVVQWPSLSQITAGEVLWCRR